MIGVCDGCHGLALASAHWVAGVPQVSTPLVAAGLCGASLLGIATFAGGHDQGRVTFASLSPPNATLGTAFTNISAVRELRDGRVLIADYVDNTIVVANLEKNETLAVGRKGQGPGEYGAVGSLIPLTEDSSLVTDSRNRRWLLLDGATIVSTVPADHPLIQATLGFALGMSDKGAVLTLMTRPVPTGVTLVGNSDSTAILLISRSAGSADTVASLRRAPQRTEAIVNPSGIKRMRIYRHPLAAEEQVLLFSDGWLAIARLDPYRVDWRSPTGRWIRGKALSVQTTKLTDRNKRTFMQRIASENGEPAKPPSVLRDWPESMPPFAAASPLGSPDGYLLLRRERLNSQDQTLYDVIDREGLLRLQVAMPGNAHIVGFGPKSVFVAISDNDGSERLQRHPWLGAIPTGR